MPWSFSSTFQGEFHFQGLFKTVLYIQVLFKPVRTLVEEEIAGCFAFVVFRDFVTVTVNVLWFFFILSWVSLLFVIVEFPDQTQFLQYGIIFFH